MNIVKEFLYNNKSAQIIDQFLTDDEHKTFIMMMEQATWRSTGHSDDKHPSKNLQLTLVGKEQSLLKDDDIFNHIRVKIERHIGLKFKIRQCYFNNYQFGSESGIHFDEIQVGKKSYTVIIPIHEEWDADWHGATLLYNDDKTQIVGGSVPMPRQAFLFDSRFNHGVEPISRYCSKHRVVLVYMLEDITEDNGDTEKTAKNYIDNYNLSN